MTLRPITCKYCSKTISPALPHIGESPQQNMARTVQLMAQHIAEESQEEQRTAKRHPKAGVKPGPHQVAEFLLSATVAGVANYQIAQSFNLSEDLEAAVEIGRHSIHEASRKVRMTDEDVESILPRWLDGELKPIPKYDGITQVARELARDLRDRYEGLGKYAPAQPTPAPAAEPVKG